MARRRHFGDTFRWLLIFASEAGDFACVDRAADWVVEQVIESVQKAFMLIGWRCGAGAFGTGNRVLHLALERYPHSAELRAAKQR